VEEKRHTASLYLDGVIQTLLEKESEFIELINKSDKVVYVYGLDWFIRLGTDEDKKRIYPLLRALKGVTSAHGLGLIRSADEYLKRLETV